MNRCMVRAVSCLAIVISTWIGFEKPVIAKNSCMIEFDKDTSYCLRLESDNKFYLCVSSAYVVAYWCQKNSY